MLEAELLAGPTPQPRQAVRDALGLVPVATAVEVRWRHAADLDGAPVIGVIADAVDAARCRVATARTAWPLSPIPIGEQCIALEQARTELRAAADLLVWVVEMAGGDDLSLEVDVIRVSSRGPGDRRAARLSRASLILRA